MGSIESHLQTIKKQVLSSRKIKITFHEILVSGTILRVLNSVGTLFVSL